MADTATRIFETTGQERLVSVQANGGSVALQVEHAPGVWITSDTITEDSVNRVYFGAARVRIVPSGGASYQVH